MADDEVVTPGSGARVAWAIVRLITAVGIAAAVIAQFATTYAIAEGDGLDLPTTVQNFFSFFTILSNCLGAVVLVIGGVWLLTRGSHRQWEPRALSFAFIAVSTYMVITGIVYNILLRGIPLEQGATLGWANEVMHTVGPIVFLLELILRIARRPLPWTAMGTALIFPIVWAVYTLSRGENVTNPATGDPYWYPYPFLNFRLVSEGYFGVAAYVAGISAAVIAVATFGVAMTRRGRGFGTVPEPANDAEGGRAKEVRGSATTASDALDLR